MRALSSITYQPCSRQPTSRDCWSAMRERNSLVCCASRVRVVLQLQRRLRARRDRAARVPAAPRLDQRGADRAVRAGGHADAAVVEVPDEARVLLRAVGADRDHADPGLALVAVGDLERPRRGEGRQRRVADHLRDADVGDALVSFGQYCVSAVAALRYGEISAAVPPRRGARHEDVDRVAEQEDARVVRARCPGSRRRSSGCCSSRPARARSRRRRARGTAVSGNARGPRLRRRAQRVAAACRRADLLQQRERDGRRAVAARRHVELRAVARRPRTTRRGRTTATCAANDRASACFARTVPPSCPSSAVPNCAGVTVVTERENVSVEAPCLRT